MADDDVDARFRDLVEGEFGVQVRGAARREPAPPTRPYRPADAFSLDRALDEADPTPDPADQFVPPVPEPIAWPRRPLVWVAVGLMLLPVLVGIVRAFGVPTAGWVGAVAALGFGAGLALCLVVLLPRRQDPDDEGIRL